MTSQKTIQPSNFPYSFIGQVLITLEQIERRVTELGSQITQDYANSERLLLIGLLRGSVVFMTDLMRNIRLPITLDFVSVSSYAGSESSGFVRMRLGSQDQYPRMGCHFDR